MLKKGLAEFIGTFFLCLIASTCSLSAHPEYTPFAVGLLYAGLTYSIGHLSGAHFNPMVSIAVFLRGKMQLNIVPIYILFQLAGAAFAGIISLLLITNKTVPSMDISNIPLEAILAEFFGSFVLAFVILNVATSKNTQGNDYYGIAIGLTFAGAFLALGGISAGEFNPAVALSLAISKLSSFSNLWIYWIGEILGGIMAAVIYLFLSGKE